MNQRKSKIFFILFSIAILSSCYDHTEGCRDINALNFDVTADKDCEDDCCKYPDVYINFRLFKDSITIDTNTILVNDYNDTFRIKYFRMYVSGFKMINDLDDTLELLNEIPVGFNENGKIEYHNINFTVAKFKTDSRSYKLGKLKKLDKYKEMIFDFGLNSRINHGLMDKVNISNPLNTANNDMYLDSISGYHFLKLEIEMSDKFIRSVYITGDEYLSKISILSNLDLRERENHYINLDIDVSKWLLPIDFYKNSDEIRNSLLNNLNKSLILYKK